MQCTVDLFNALYLLRSNTVQWKVTERIVRGCSYMLFLTSSWITSEQKYRLRSRCRSMLQENKAAYAASLKVPSHDFPLKNWWTLWEICSRSVKEHWTRKSLGITSYPSRGMKSRQGVYCTRTLILFISTLCRLFHPLPTVMFWICTQATSGSAAGSVALEVSAIWNGRQTDPSLRQVSRLGPLDKF